jgi:ribosome-binding protein aMBF1 (putative translation factor)
LLFKSEVILTSLLNATLKTVLGKKNKKSSQSPEFDILTDTVKRAREATGLSQREVGKRMGFHPTVFGKVERGERVLDIVEFLNLARALGIEPLALFADYLLALQRERLSP